MITYFLNCTVIRLDLNPSGLLNIIALLFGPSCQYLDPHSMCHLQEFLPFFLKQMEVVEEVKDDLARFKQEYIHLKYSQAFYFHPFHQN